MQTKESRGKTIGMPENTGGGINLLQLKREIVIWSYFGLLQCC